MSVTLFPDQEGSDWTTDLTRTSGRRKAFGSAELLLLLTAAPLLPSMHFPTSSDSCWGSPGALLLSEVLLLSEFCLVQTGAQVSFPTWSSGGASEAPDLSQSESSVGLFYRPQTKGLSLNSFSIPSSDLKIISVDRLSHPKLQNVLNVSASCHSFILKSLKQMKNIKVLWWV